MKIAEVDLSVVREPFSRPFGVKGGYVAEKWINTVRLKTTGGLEVEAEGGMATLWSDPDFFAEHTVAGGNLLMASVLETALQQCKGLEFATPIELLQELLEPAFEAAKRITDRPNLRRTFVYNSLIALDNAAWLLRAAELGARTFDDMIPEEYRTPLTNRQERLYVTPVVAYGTPLEEARDLVMAGHPVLKVKLGAPGDEETMMKTDLEGLDRLWEGLREVWVGGKDQGRSPLYYLDVNGRYWKREQLERVAAHLSRTGMIESVCLVEEPFQEGLDLSVDGLDLLVAADESLHDVKDVKQRAELGYGAVALKPAGKTLSLSLLMAMEAARHDLLPFVADSATTPRLIDWNRNLSARLPTFPGLDGGLIESNGAQFYKDWDRLVRGHSCYGAAWVEPVDGAFQLDDDFYQNGGGLISQPGVPDGRG